MEQTASHQKTPAFVGVYETMYGLLKRGVFPINTPLPSEPKLAQQLGVSRMTLRQALALLQEDGLIQKVHGKGNFVTQVPRLTTAGLQQVGNPVHRHCLRTIDEVELAVRVEVPTEYELQQLRRHTPVAVAVDRWYRSKGTIVGYTLTMMPVEPISEYGIDLNDHGSLEKFLEQWVYELAQKAQIRLQISSTGLFISEKYAVSPSEQLYLLTELLYREEEEAPLMCNKHYLVPEYFSLEITATQMGSVG